MYLQKMVAIGLCFWAFYGMAEDFASQKQLFIGNLNTNESFSCQIVRIHANWFLTSAHCVDECKKDHCNLKVLLAKGQQASAWAIISDQDIFLPEEYRKGNFIDTISWDIALLHYQPRYYEFYEFKLNEENPINREKFEKLAKQEEALSQQWKGAIEPVLPELVLHSSVERVELEDNNVVVPRWTHGAMKYYSNPNLILYTGKLKAMWVTSGFGVSMGNSGGGVWMDQNNTLLGIVSAQHRTSLSRKVRKAYPQLGETSEYFAFTGFAESTTWKFINDTLSRYGDKVTTKTLGAMYDFTVE